MSEQPKLGHKIEGPDPGRDAVHVAVLPAVAAERLRPGDRVKVVARDGELFASWAVLGAAGIVDPYLEASDPVLPGERFYVCLFPRTVTTLRHVWTAAGVPEEGPTDGRDGA
jgi:hypothetical protein